MITIHTPIRANGFRASVSFSNPYAAQDWIDRQISGGDDGDWTVSSSYLYLSLDEHDKDKGIGEYGPKPAKFVFTGKRVPYSVQAALRREQEEGQK